MRSYKGVIIKHLFFKMLLNPIFIFVYCISVYQLYTLCKYGRHNNNVNILVFSMIFYLIWIAIFIVKAKINLSGIVEEIIEIYNINENRINIFYYDELIVKLSDIKSFDINKKYIFILTTSTRKIIVLDVEDKTVEEREQIKKILDSNLRIKSTYKLVWNYIAIAIIVAVTIFYGYKVYNTAIRYNGRLSWVLEDLKNKRTVEFEHDNIYEYGIEGIFIDIDKKMNIPEEVYISNSFDLTFSSDGTITKFDTFIYGNDDGELKSLLISYDNSKSNKIIIHSNGYVDADYNEDKKLKPLIDTMEVIPLEETISQWNEDKYGVIYYGKRSFGYNIDGIIYIDSNGDIKHPTYANSEVVGYTVSIFVPNKQDLYTPQRYNLVESLGNISADKLLHLNENEDEDNQYKDSQKLGLDIAEEFYLSDNIGFSLAITDAALGSRFYSLYGTKDGGTTWEVVNGDPFLGSGGVASGMTFINNNVEFLSLSHSGGSYSDLYRTEDVGLSYEKIDFPEVKVLLNEEKYYNPFDFPKMPYEENGEINILVGQGSDGDYNGGCKALYKSKDIGKTWEYIKEVNNN